MHWYALEEIEEAAKRTRELLLPFDWRLWARIAVMAFFVGGFTFPGFSGGDFSSGSHDYGDMNGHGMMYDQGSSPQLSDGFGLSNIVLFAIVFAVAGISLLFGVLRAVFGFVYYQSLIDDEARIRRNFSEHFVNGLKLFVFEVAAIVLFMIAMAVLILPVFVAPIFAVLTVLLAIPTLIAAIVFLQFTTDFIPLFVIENDQGIIESWRELYDLIWDEWKQLGLYVVVKMVLGVMVQVAIASASLLIALLLLLPVGIIVFALYLLMPPLALVGALIGLITLIVGIVYFLNGPATTFFRYYSLLVYNDITQERSDAEN